MPKESEITQALDRQTFPHYDGLEERLWVKGEHPSFGEVIDGYTGKETVIYRQTPREDVVNLDYIDSFMGEIEEEHPATDRSVPWRVDKVGEEARELQAEMTSEPMTKVERDRIIDENIDVLITAIWLQRKLEVSPEMTFFKILGKLLVVRERYADGHYDRNPHLKGEPEVPGYYNQSINTEEYVSEFE